MSLNRPIYTQKSWGQEVLEVTEISVGVLTGFSGSKQNTIKLSFVVCCGSCTWRVTGGNRVHNAQSWESWREEDQWGPTAHFAPAPPCRPCFYPISVGLYRDNWPNQSSAPVEALHSHHIILFVPAVLWFRLDSGLFVTHNHTGYNHVMSLQCVNTKTKRLTDIFCGQLALNCT